MKKRVFRIIFLALITVGTVAFSFLASTTVNTIYIDGEYLNFSQEESNGYYPLARVLISDGVITEVQIDAISMEGVLKSDLSKAGGYIMTEDGALIHEQYEDIANFIVQTGSTAGLNLNEEGRTDVVSSASIKVMPYVSLIDEILAMVDASDASMTVLKSDVASGGYFPQATITYKDKTMLAIEFDAITEDGTSKVAQSEAGEYVMTENGPLIHEQLNDLASYILSHQGTSGLNLNEEGKTDVVSSASISVVGYTSLVDEFLAQ
ncbi:MAG: hypothetical protein R3Y09_04460 [Clostridia bacterium]